MTGDDTGAGALGLDFGTTNTVAALTDGRGGSQLVEFEGEAANTVNFLRGMLNPQSNMRPFVVGMMPEIGPN